jgi:hypothetical protein
MIMRKMLLRAAIVAGAAIMAGIALQPSASAEPEPSGVGLATFEGKTIDLRNGWGDAQVCVVFSTTNTECFSTAAEADKKVGYSPATDTAPGAAGIQASGDCPWGWECIWADINFTGRRLQFSEEMWHNLYDWGFAHQTSSWYNRMACGLPWDDAGAIMNDAGNQLQLGDCSLASQMGGWNDQAVGITG